MAFDRNRIAPLMFAWHKGAGAKSYEIQFASDSSFKSIIAEKTATSNQFLLDERFSGSETYWRVRTRFESDASLWSKPRSFEIKAVEK